MFINVFLFAYVKLTNADKDENDKKKKFNYYFSTVNMYPSVEKSMKVYELKNSSSWLLDDDDDDDNNTTNNNQTT